MDFSSLQINHFDSELARLQLKYGDKNLHFINGAGCINRPKLMFIFMNPTAKNVSAHKNWHGLRAPWIGTKNIWKMLFALNIISDSEFHFISHSKPTDWTPDFALKIFSTVAKNKVYITNLAKCTQLDARPIPNSVFKEYLKYTLQEIAIVKPQKIITFGTQVSSLILNKPIKLSESKKELANVHNQNYCLFPCYYPVGQGQRNMPKAIELIQQLI